MPEIDADIQAMIADGTAKNVFNASAIANLLRLWELTDQDAKRARWTLYRKFRFAGEGSKAAAVRARAGEDAPLELIPKEETTTESEVNANLPF